MLTKPFTFSGRELVVNYATSAAGGIRIELRDDSGGPAPGFAAADADELVGDEIERVVTWRDASDVSALQGKPVRLRALMKDADLYSIRFR